MTDLEASLEGYRQLAIHWNYVLLACSFVVSFLGAYAASQVCCQASSCRRQSLAFFAWNGLAAILFGLCAIWGLHFLAILAARLDVAVSLNPVATVLSALLAVSFTWLALVSDSFTAKYLRKRRKHAKRRMAENANSDSGVTRPTKHSNGSSSTPTASTPDADLENQPLLPRQDSQIAYDNDPESALDTSPHDNVTSMKRELNEASYLRALAMGENPSAPPSVRSAESPSRTGGFGGSRPIDAGELKSSLRNATTEATNGETRQATPDFFAFNPPEPVQTPLNLTDTVTQPASQSSKRPRRPSFPFFGRNHSSGKDTAKLSAGGQSSNDQTDTDSEARPTTPGTTTEGDGTSLSGSSGSHGIVKYLPLSRREKKRLRAGGGMGSIPVRELMLTLWGDCTREACAKALIWATAIAGMHYLGCAAVIIDQGLTRWNHWLVGLSYIIAFVVCLIGTLFMPNMEVHIGRQLAFSFVAASGVCSMHMTGQAAATFYSRAAPTDHPGFPDALPFSIVALTIATCLVSTTLVSHAATISRNKLIEMIHVKQQLWKTLAQKEAVEATVALQTEFTSVAAHELRTPLYTITGYIDLLARTAMDDEQALYVETVRRACHTIQLITTNVLDFTRLERANDEAQARPVLIELRRFLTELAEITEDRGPRADADTEGLELLLDIAQDLPDAVFLDETYLTRVIMNLVNNAVKFCTSGYIRIGAERNGDNIILSVTDTGIGIPKRFQQRIFEPFRQADTSLTRVNNGSGLGLAICKRLVARLEGDLSVTSTEGEGSTFYVDLKKPTVSDRAPSVTANEAIKPSQKMMVVTRSLRTEVAVAKAWKDRGFTILSRPLSLEDIRKADFVWTDIPTVLKQEPLLLESIKAFSADASVPRPYFLLLYSAETELLALPRSSRVIPIKRPIAFHRILQLLQSPEDLPTLAGREKPKLVRFASVQSSTLSEENETPPLTAEDKNDLKEAPASGSAVSPPISSAQQAMAIDSGKKTILLVEDNLVNAKLGERMLTTLGYRVLPAYNGLEALEAVKMAHDSIYMTLMDCQMPVMSGEESTAAIRKYEAENNLRRIVILALSANVTSASSNRVLDNGADAFLSKPITLSGIREAIAKYADPSL